MGLVVDRIATSLGTLWGISPEIHRPSPVVPIVDNYDRLLYPADAPARSDRYARYLGDGLMLRTHTTAAIPPLLSSITGPDGASMERLLLCPGLVYRRDCVDRTHVGEPHQLDVWRITNGPRLGLEDLVGMVRTVLEAIFSGARWRAAATSHPYTDEGLEIEAEFGGRWVEILECGLASQALLSRCGLDPGRWSGLALGLGLDRAVMLAKRIDDIRLLRAEDPRIASQMRDLASNRPVSRQQASTRDLSVAAPAGMDDEEAGDRIRAMLGVRADLVEEVRIVARHAARDVPPQAAARLGLRGNQENLLVRVVVRAPDRPVSRAEAAEIQRLAYQALHSGEAPGYMA
uniref:PheS-related mystery ligase SrmL n=1 Tax=Arenibaculum pallidiluteum TaxID=2812559 RepID=UPI001A96E3C7|nr:hypothetical protein [Arenibaculum pallidiluteum]